ncbi:unnamed protein product [Bursaphelenchus okinawaensis]|uniref:NADH dehydrogenase [ubiquinone] 1 beta subcomplex subunit 11, mitochondrial n=1 Tax=Bursaphelenchus okinawaensis TaxID=465554 RepID=A0A811KTK5_9BILA|nr:unnamed protein product [Bursaphelenchus okinawaensis]CAG9112353.1 unnamed protein product [Bursaphelenchus okinawaensis]
MLRKFDRPPTFLLRTCRRFASGHGHDDHHHHGDPINDKLEKQSPEYRPGSDTYAYENPWPKLNKGRLDWMFNDGWRRPLAPDQGGRLRKEWLWFGVVGHNEHADWKNFHTLMFGAATVLSVYVFFVLIFLRSDWPSGKEWALREAYFELERRQKAGLPLISKDFIDPERVKKNLPSDEELRDFAIII